MAVLNPAAEFHLTARTLVAPGDIRGMGAETRIFLYRGVRDRDDWTALISALGIAVGKGASVEWLR